MGRHEAWISDLAGMDLNLEKCDGLMQFSVYSEPSAKLCVTSSPQEVGSESQFQTTPHVTFREKFLGVQRFLGNEFGWECNPHPCLTPRPHRMRDVTRGDVKKFSICCFSLLCEHTPWQQLSTLLSHTDITLPLCALNEGE